YTEAFTEDEPSPLSAPRRSSFKPGIYLPRLPGLRRIDLRAEGGYTDLPGFRFIGSYYSNIHYRSGYTNEGQLIGSWLGRQGRGMQFWSTYWLNPASKIQFSYRKHGVNPAFLGGGTLHSFETIGQFQVTPAVDLTGTVMAERTNFPLLGMN